MINTLNIKQQQLTNTYFQVGSGKEKVLIMGSCRVCPLVNYLNEWNITNGNRFTIYSIDPFNHHWNIKDERVDYEAALCELETDERLLSMLKSVDIFIHEWYQNAGMFNCNKDAENNIYKYGIAPKMDICTPSWNDCFVLVGDIVSMDVEIRKKAIQDYNVIGKLSEQTAAEIYEISQKGFEKFYSVCRKSDLPEMEDIFKAAYINRRFYWNSNHVSKHFTLNIFSLINEKYLHLDLDDGFWYAISAHDMYANNFTYLTEVDLAFYNYQWNEEVKPLKEKL